MPLMIGTKADQVPTNGMLGTAAHHAADQLPVSEPQAAAMAPLSLVKLATLTPTAVAQIDALSTFTSGYDSYEIIGTGITFAADDGLSIRLATGGAADSTSSYYALSGSESTTALNIVAVTSAASVRSAGKGLSFRIQIDNANDTARVKRLRVSSTWQSTTGGTPGFTNSDQTFCYVAANAVSGLRLLSTLGNNFAATGTVRIYGIR